MVVVVGSYIILNSKEGTTDSRAMLQSPLLSSSKNLTCLMFYYHMSGDNTGSLSVDTWSARTGDRTVVWSLKGKQERAWMQGSVPLPQHQDYGIYVTGVMGGDTLADIAVDDIDFTNEPCQSEIFFINTVVS